MRLVGLYLMLFLMGVGGFWLGRRSAPPPADHHYLHPGCVYPLGDSRGCLPHHITVTRGDPWGAIGQPNLGFCTDCTVSGLVDPYSATVHFSEADPCHVINWTREQVLHDALLGLLPAFCKKLAQR
jgi:hypothetical protein